MRIEHQGKVLIVASELKLELVKGGEFRVTFIQQNNLLKHELQLYLAPGQMVQLCQGLVGGLAHVVPQGVSTLIQKP